MEQAHEADVVGQMTLEVLRVEPAIVREGEDLDPDPSLGGEPLPDDQVRVVFPVRDQHPVAPPPAEPLAHQVDRFGGVAQEHDPPGVRPSEEAGERRAGVLVPSSDLFGEAVQAPPRAARVLPIVLVHGREHRTGDEGHAGGVEVDGSGPAGAGSEGGEVRPKPLDVHGALCCRLSAAAASVAAPITSARSSGAKVALWRLAGRPGIPTPSRRKVPGTRSR